MAAFAEPSGTEELSTAQLLELLDPGLQRWIQANWGGRRGGAPGFSTIQRRAIPVLLDGPDCVLEAPTASGKTEAVLFPVLTRAARMEGSGVRVLYLAPLRALLNNLEGRGEEYAGACRLTAFKWHGDVSQTRKVQSLRDPPDLLMTTPESLEAILLRKAEWAQFFASVAVVVLDEAHNFAAGDRGGHLVSLLARLEAAVPNRPQRIAMSATVGNPEAMLDWLAGGDRERGQRICAPPVAKARDFQVCFFEDSGDPANPGTTGRFRRFRALADLLPGKRTLIFVRSRRGAERLAKGFEVERQQAAGQHLRIRTHHSAVSKFFREQAEEQIQWKSEDGLHAIISTSTLELGIDIGALNLVVQMGGLASSSSFLQRVGRTGRREGEPQSFRGLCLKANDLLLLTATVQLGLEGRSEALRLPRRAFHLLAHQLLCLSLQEFGVAPERAWATLRSCHCYSGIRREEFDGLVDYMVAQEYLRSVDGVLVAGPRTEKKFLGAGWRRLFAVFDSAPLYDVMHGKQQVGTLDAGFVEALETPFFFVLGGQLWHASRVDPRARLVTAQPSKEGEAPRWNSFGGPDVPFETAQRVGQLLHIDKEVPEFLNPAGEEVVEGERLRARNLSWKPGDLLVLTERGGTGEILTYAGDRINRTLAKALELAEVGQCTAAYDRVQVEKGPEGAEGFEQAIASVFTELEQGAWSRGIDLAQALQDTQPRWAFSPFARCLPPDLWASALIEQSLDCPRLLRLVETGRLR